MSQRRTHSGESKALFALEAVLGQKTVNRLTRKYEVHEVQDRAIMLRSCNKAGKSGQWTALDNGLRRLDVGGESLIMV